MTKPIPIPPSGFDDLSCEEQIAYVEALWQHVVSSGPLPVTDAQRRVLDERWTRHEASPNEAVPWSEVRAELDAKYGLE